MIGRTMRPIRQCTCARMLSMAKWLNLKLFHQSNDFCFRPNPIMNNSRILKAHFHGGSHVALPLEQQARRWSWFAYFGWVGGETWQMFTYVLLCIPVLLGEWNVMDATAVRSVFGVLIFRSTVWTCPIATNRRRATEFNRASCALPGGDTSMSTGDTYWLTTVDGLCCNSWLHPNLHKFVEYKSGTRWMQIFRMSFFFARRCLFLGSARILEMWVPRVEEGDEPRCIRL